jgi:hypothetical protein
MIAPKSLTVSIDGKELSPGTYTWRRALTLWRVGRRYSALVTHDGIAITQGEVDWSGWEDQPPRASGAPGTRRSRDLVIEVTVTEMERDALRERARAAREDLSSYLRRRGLAE